MAFKYRYAGDPETAASIASAMRRAKEAEQVLESGPATSTQEGSIKTAVAPEQGKVGDMGVFAGDSREHKEAVWKRAGDAFKFEHEFLNPPDPEVLA